MFQLRFRNHPEGLEEHNRKAWNLTYSLIEFCDLHDFRLQSDHVLRRCLDALSVNNRSDAVNFAKSVPIGGNGCFNDVFVAPVLKHENELTVQIHFEALLSCWLTELLETQS